MGEDKVSKKGKRRRRFGGKGKGRDIENRKISVGNGREVILCLLEIL